MLTHAHFDWEGFEADIKRMSLARLNTLLGVLPLFRFWHRWATLMLPLVKDRGVVDLGTLNTTELLRAWSEAKLIIGLPWFHILYLIQERHLSEWKERRLEKNFWPR